MKTITQIVNIFLISTAIFLLHSCEKPKSEPISCTNNTMLLPQMAKDYFLFKDGSYWVYQNIISKQIDSVYIVEFKNWTGDNNIFKNGNKLTKCYECYEYRVFSSNTVNHRIGLFPLLPDNSIDFKNQIFNINEINSITGQLYPRIEFEGNSLLDTNYVLNGSVQIIDFLTIDTFEFSNVIYLKNPNGGINWTINSYYAPNIGLIKFTTNDNQTYELIKYHINQ